MPVFFTSLDLAFTYCEPKVMVESPAEAANTPPLLSKAISESAIGWFFMGVLERAGGKNAALEIAAEGFSDSRTGPTTANAERYIITITIIQPCTEP